MKERELVSMISFRRCTLILGFSLGVGSLDLVFNLGFMGEVISSSALLQCQSFVQKLSLAESTLTFSHTSKFLAMQNLSLMKIKTLDYMNTDAKSPAFFRFFFVVT